MTGGSVATSGGATFVLNSNMTVQLRCPGGDQRQAQPEQRRAARSPSTTARSCTTCGSTPTSPAAAPAARFDKTGGGAVLLTGDNKNLTGSSEVQTVSRAQHGHHLHPDLPRRHHRQPSQLRAGHGDRPSRRPWRPCPRSARATSRSRPQRHETRSSTRSPTSTTWAGSTSGRSRAAVTGGTGTITTATPTGGVWAFGHSAGAIAVGSDTALGIGGVAANNGTLWAYGGPRTIKWVHTNNATTYFGARRDWGPVDGSGNPVSAVHRLGAPLGRHDEPPGRRSAGLRPDRRAERHSS